MTDSIMRFRPLNDNSQSDYEAVFYYDSDASLEAIYNCLTGRLEGVINLLNTLHNHDKCPTGALQAVSIASTLLLGDVYSLLEEFSPIGLEHRVLQQ